jgi:uncharacterized protein YbjT (DUF2867 family)
MILVTGATGNVGSEIVRALQDAGESIRALIRSPDSAMPSGVQTVLGDLNEPASLEGALRGVSGLFLLSGYQGTRGLLSRAGDAGVKRVVLLSGGGAVASDLDNAISRYQLESEEAVRECGIAWTILRPYAFMSNALRWADQVRAGDVVRLPFAGVATAVIDPRDIAQVAVAALLSGDHHAQTYRLSGPNPLLPAEQVRIVGETIGRELHFQAQADSEARAAMEASMPAEYVQAFLSFYADGTLDESEVLPTVEQLTGSAPRTFRDWAQEHADMFR